jgi:ribosome recycling factor
VIEVPIPKLTKEVRENLIKTAKKSAETIRERVRGVRRDAMTKIKKSKGEGVSEDDVHRQEKQVCYYSNFLHC